METEKPIPVLSICFWTYNDSDALLNNVRNLLSIEDTRFRIIIQDNASTDATENLIRNINDNRIIYRRNPSNIGGQPNALKSVTDLNSLYGMTVVTRDRIKVDEISKFIDFLETKKPDMGRIDLTASRNSKTIDYVKPGYDAFDKLAYQNQHPSGYFWKVPIIMTGIKSMTTLNVDKYFDFCFELIYGASCPEHGGAIYRFPVIIPQYENFKNVKKTGTYSKDNYFFSPKKRMLVFETYIKQLDNLKITSKQRKIISNKLFSILLNQITYGYRECMTNENIRYHYNIQEAPPKKLDYLKYVGSVMFSYSNSLKRFYASIKSMVKVILYY